MGLSLGPTAVAFCTDYLFADQMYYDQKTEWVFTNNNVRYITNGSVQLGRFFDSDRNFDFLEILEHSGEMELDNN